ncbi:2-amino-4-hydroxy-6-hydroxymethyldihydropteridine pyrophosphokinase [Arsukibacterium sp. MJ3]|uniref:2-amino-4-hydroxy-6- hydroxymethyldihydropteridine diphosphokinase n=1 Tax=Arsukibacterium sp. MJ3 TaxID=1632859 RepID=UPI0006270807|nr:2-amino-4-hydroxy-6-hydroxymethyldihydropteridine diphosphokinase [Arsukibacterium sp. MJ3]KKO50370.1 2-amino-4-hydroxy-6-hydroxymethyldihydropteridine pyrophosphokinase [Arsukibacterium sp. MJ3]
MSRIFISIGSNTDRDHYVRSGVLSLQQHFGALQLSSVYESDAVGFNGDAFYNLVAATETELSVADCVQALKQIEDRHGRIRGAEKFCGRTLDLDLLTYDQLTCQQPIILPRGEITENAFVLWPMAELAPQNIHPLTGLSYAELWQNYPKNKQKIWPVPFNWSECN